MEITITLDSKDYSFYRKKCLLRLQELFKVCDEPYSEKADVEKACKECLLLLSTEFENECKKVISCSDVAFFMSFYSEINNSERYSGDDIVISKKMCKYLFGELTKLNFTTNKVRILDDHFVSRLFHITKLIYEFTQNFVQLQLDPDCDIQLELYSDIYGITTNSSEYAMRIQELSRINISELLLGESIGSQYIIKAATEWKNIFGNAAIDFFDAFAKTETSFVNLDEYSEEDFINLLKNNFDPDPNGIVDLTDTINHYPNDSFYNGLILSANNVNLYKSILAPHDISLRIRYRPIVLVNVDGCKRYITTKNLASEAIQELTANQIPFNEIPTEWKNNKKMCDYASASQLRHDKLLENPVDNLLKDMKLLFLRNKKSINNIDLNKEEIGNSGKHVGEIDFIIIDKTKMKVYVCDCKFIKTKYDWASFNVDKRKFEGETGYNQKLSYKLNWVKFHIETSISSEKRSMTPHTLLRDVPPLKTRYFETSSEKRICKIVVTHKSFSIICLSSPAFSAV